MYKFFNYSGTKIKYSKKINNIIQYTDKKTYIEPFVGSGAILFNLNIKFDRYIINDIDRNIINMYKSFKNTTYKHYIEVVNTITDMFTDSIGFCVSGNLAHDVKYQRAKEHYYNLRNYFNENYYNTNTVEEGIILNFLSVNVINSFLRFGKNGMNQGFGNRCGTMSKETFNHINSVLKRSEIYNEDYKKHLDYDGVYFLDPPYFNNDSSYKNFNEDDLLKFLKLIENKEYIYTDILNEHNKNIPYKMHIREMIHTSPSKRSKDRKSEYIFSPLIKKMNDELTEW